MSLTDAFEFKFARRTWAWTSCKPYMSVQEPLQNDLWTVFTQLLRFRANGIPNIAFEDWKFVNVHLNRVCFWSLNPSLCWYSDDSPWFCDTSKCKTWHWWRWMCFQWLKDSGLMKISDKVFKVLLLCENEGALLASIGNRFFDLRQTILCKNAVCIGNAGLEIFENTTRRGLQSSPKSIGYACEL